MPQRGRIPALQRLATAAALLGRTGHHDLHLLERDQHPRMGWMAGLPTALAARGLWGRTPFHAWPIARRGPGGVLRILIDTVFERSQFGLERRNALLVPLNQYLQRGLDIRRDPVPELFGQRQLSLAHAASHIPVPVFPQVRPMNAYYAPAYAHDEEALPAPTCSSHLGGTGPRAHPTATICDCRQRLNSLPRGGGDAYLSTLALRSPARTRAGRA